MYVYMYAYMYVCIYVCMYHVCMYVCIYMYVCTYVCIYVYIHECIYVCTHAWNGAPNFKMLLNEVFGVKTFISTHDRLSTFASLQTLLVQDKPTLRYTRAGLTKMQSSREVLVALCHLNSFSRTI